MRDHLNSHNKNWINYLLCKLDNLFEIKWHNGEDFNCSTASGYSFRIGKFCILMIQNHPNGAFDGIIKFPFNFNTKQEINVIVTDNTGDEQLSYAKVHVGWTRTHNGAGVHICGVGAGHTITVIGVLA